MLPVLRADKAFSRYYNRKYLNRMRGGMVAAILLFGLFGLLEVLTLPPAVYHQTLLVRLAVVLPVLLAVWAATYRPYLFGHMQKVLGTAAFLVLNGVVLILWLARREGASLPYEGILLATLFVYLLLGLRLIGALVCGWTSCIAYVLMERHVGLEGDALLYNAMFLISANIIGSVGAYFSDAVSLENYKAEQALQQLAERDFLTGLYNRRVMQERASDVFAQAKREQRSVAVALMDVDFFKRFNDLYGHGEGDEVLRRVAASIQASARRPLDFTARYGGEEFVGVWYDLSAADGRERVEEICRCVRELGIAHRGSSAAEVVTLSAGVVSCEPGETFDLQQCLQRADAALYQAKAQGRDRVVPSWTLGAGAT